MQEYANFIISQTLVSILPYPVNEMVKTSFVKARVNGEIFLAVNVLKEIMTHFKKHLLEFANLEYCNDTCQ